MTSSPDKLSIADAERLAEEFSSETTKAHYRQLADSMREVERLTAIEERLITYGCHNQELRNKITEILGHPYKQPDVGSMLYGASEAKLSGHEDSTEDVERADTV